MDIMILVYIGLGGFLVYSFFLKGYFVKGDVEDGVMIIDEHSSSLYLLINYENWQFARSGSYEVNRYRLRKIDLKTQDIVFETKVSQFTSGLLKGFNNIIGFSNNHFFILTGENSFVIIESKTGKRIGNKKTILKKNPHIKDIIVPDIKYSESLKTLIILDNVGQSHYLDTDTLELIKLNDHQDKAKNELDYYAVKKQDLPGIEFKEWMFASKRDSRHYFPRALYIKFLREKGSAKYYLKISKEEIEDIKPEEMKNTFLCPHILSYNAEYFPYIHNSEPTLLLMHANEFRADPRELMISAVYGKSEISWTKKLDDIFVRPYFGDNHTVRYFELEDTIIFMMFYGESKYKLSMSVMDKRTGKVYGKPKLFVNRRINKLFGKE